jgi:hypothetical protein
MGIDAVALETEEGEEIDSISDPKNTLHGVLPQPDDATFPCLRFVEKYYDTVFNPRQMAEVVKEIDRIVTKLGPAHEARPVLEKIREMASRNRERCT